MAKKYETHKITEWVIFSKKKNAIWLYPFSTRIAAQLEWEAQMAKLTQVQRELADWKIEPFNSIVKKAKGRDDGSDNDFGDF